MTRAERDRMAVAMEVRRARTEMESWGFAPREIEEEVDRIRRLGLGPLTRRQP